MNRFINGDRFLFHRCVVTLTSLDVSGQESDWPFPLVEGGRNGKFRHITFDHIRSCIVDGKKCCFSSCFNDSTALHADVSRGNEDDLRGNA